MSPKNKNSKKPNKKTKNEEILETARKRFEISSSAEDENRQAAVEDINFTYNYGENGQWPSEIRAEREGAGRPCITVNKLVKFVKLLAGEQQQNRITNKARPVDNKADVQTAGVFDDIIRHIQQISIAEIAHDTAYKQAMAGSFGYYRIVHDYLDDESFDQDILIKRIFNQFSVYFDPHAEEFDLSDAMYCIITEKISWTDFKALYPDKEKTDFDNASTGEEYSKWFFKEEVRIAEYFYKEPVTKTFVQCILKEVPDSKIEIKEIKDEVTKEVLEKVGYEILKTKEVKAHKIMWCKMTGDDFLEEPREWVGKYIPVIRVVGDEINIQGKRVLRSLIRDSKDPQRTYNYQITAATETVALVPKSPYIATAQQLEGYENMWREANTKNLPYLLYKHQQGQPAPQRQQQAQVPTGAITLAQIGAGDILDTMGIYEPSLGQQGNERSGVAIAERKLGSKTLTFDFINNLRKSMNYETRILIDLIPKIYDAERVIRLFGEDGNAKILELNKAIPGKNKLFNDLSVGKYDVAPDIGQLHANKRAETASKMIEFLQFAPDAASIVIDLIAKHQDWPGAEEFAERLKFILPPEIQQQIQAKNDQQAIGRQ